MRTVEMKRVVVNEGRGRFKQTGRQYLVVLGVWDGARRVTVLT